MVSESQTEDRAPAPPSFRSSFLLNYACLIIYSAGNFAMGVIIAKLATVVDAGFYQFGVAFTQPIIQFAMLNLRAIHVTDVRRDYPYSVYLGLRLSCMAITTLVYLGMAVSGHMTALEGQVLVITGLGVIFDALSDIFYGLHQITEHVKYMSYSMAIKGILSPVFLFVAWHFTHDIRWAIAGSAIASGVVMLFYDVPMARYAARMLYREESYPSWKDYLTPSFDRAQLFALTWMVLPMGANSLVGTLNQQMSKFFANGLGKHDLGVYGQLAQLMVVGATAVNAFGQVASPRLARFYANGDKTRYFRLAPKLVGLAVLMGLVMVIAAELWGHPLLAIVYRKDYANYTTLFQVLMIAGLLQYLQLTAGILLTAARYYSVQTGLSIIGLCVSILLLWQLVPRYGLIGLGWATVGAFAARMLAYYVVVILALNRMPKPPPKEAAA